MPFKPTNRLVSTKHTPSTQSKPIKSIPTSTHHTTHSTVTRFPLFTLVLLFCYTLSHSTVYTRFTLLLFTCVISGKKRSISAVRMRAKAALIDSHIFCVACSKPGTSTLLNSARNDSTIDCLWVKKNEWKRQCGCFEWFACSLYWFFLLCCIRQCVLDGFLRTANQQTLDGRVAAERTGQRVCNWQGEQNHHHGQPNRTRKKRTVVSVDVVVVVGWLLLLCGCQFGLQLVDFVGQHAQLVLVLLRELIGQLRQTRLQQRIDAVHQQRTGRLGA